MPVKGPLAKTNENYNLIGNTKVRLVNELVFTVKHNKKEIRQVSTSIKEKIAKEY